MRRLSKISHFFYLAGITAILIGSVYGSGFQKNISYAGNELGTVTGSEDMLYSTPFPTLLLSEIMADSNSEIEPN